MVLPLLDGVLDELFAAVITVGSIGSDFLPWLKQASASNGFGRWHGTKFLVLNLRRIYVEEFMARVIEFH